MPALRMTLCLLRWNSLAATQSPPKNSSVTLRMGKTLEALTAPAEGRRNSSGCATVSSETPLLRSWGVCKPDRAERERSPHIPSGLGDWCQPLSGLCSGGPALGGGHFKSLSNVTSCLHCKFYLGAWSLESHRAHLRWSVVLSCLSQVARSPFVSDGGLGVNTGRIRLSWEPQILGRGFTYLEGIPVPNRGHH